MPSQFPSITFWKDFPCSVRKQWNQENRDTELERRSYQNAPDYWCRFLTDGPWCRWWRSMMRCEAEDAGKSGGLRMEVGLPTRRVWDQPWPSFPPASSFLITTTWVQHLPFYGRMSNIWWRLAQTNSKRNLQSALVTSLGQWEMPQIAWKLLCATRPASKRLQSSKEGTGEMPGLLRSHLHIINYEERTIHQHLRDESRTLLFAKFMEIINAFSKPGLSSMHQAKTSRGSYILIWVTYP